MFYPRKNKFLITLVISFSLTLSAQANPVRIVGGEDYGSIQAAYNAANTGDTILVQSGSLFEDLTLNRDITITVQAGYDSGFSSVIGTSQLFGTGSITSGQAILANLIIRAGESIFTTPPELTFTPSLGGEALYENDTITISFNYQDYPQATEYRFFIDDVLIQDWSTQPSLSWQATPGQHTLRLEVHSGQNQDSYEQIFYVFMKPVENPE